MKKMTKEEMKKVIGGVEDSGGTRCVVYCCDNDGNCGPGTTLPGVNSCTSNEDCQSLANSGGHNTSCLPGYYVAALCKG